MIVKEKRKIVGLKMKSKKWKGSAVLAFFTVGITVISSAFAQDGQYNNNLELWHSQRPSDMANIVDLEVMCGNSHMEVQLTFDKPFNGIVFSKGAVDRYNCIYVKPQTGLSQYKFDIMYDACGSKPDLNGKFYENNIVIQYDKDLIEVWDEAKRLRCEWYNDYEKGVTKAPIKVSDLEVVELNFRGDNVDCWMEIQQGKGPWATPVTGIVPLGTTLTMVVGIDDKEGEFDMRLKSCEASDSRSKPIQLSDENGCVLRTKMISKFMKMKSTDSRATVVTYAFFHAFKFPDSMAVNIRCKVEICRYGCPDHCQSPGSYLAREQEVSSSIGSNYPPSYSVTKRNISPENSQSRISQSQVLEARSAPSPPGSRYSPPPPLSKLLLPNPLPLKESPRKNVSPNQRLLTKKSSGPSISNFLGNFMNFPSFFRDDPHQPKEKVKKPPPLPPKVPNLEPQARRPSAVPVQRTANHGQPLVFASTYDTVNNPIKPIERVAQGGSGGGSGAGAKGLFPYGPRSLNLDKEEKKPPFLSRVQRELKRTERSAELGVQSGYEVISEVDLAFDSREVIRDADRVTTFQGRISPYEDIVYGICLPATGFSALFVLLALLTVMSVIISGFVCYQRQQQKIDEVSAPRPLRSIDPVTVTGNNSTQFQKEKPKNQKNGIPPPFF